MILSKFSEKMPILSKCIFNFESNINTQNSQTHIILVENFNENNTDLK
jgi:hypothetical protein